MEKNRKSGVKYGVLVGLFLIAAVSAAFGFNIPGLGSKVEKLKPVNGVVTVPLARVSDGKAHYYRVVEGGKEISFFVVKGSDGAIHTAFDACDVCFKEKKGYQQQGDQMICKNCNMKFAVNKIGAASGGGCNPSYLPAKNDGKNLTFSISEIKTGARFF